MLLELSVPDGTSVFMFYIVLIVSVPMEAGNEMYAALGVQIISYCIVSHCTVSYCIVLYSRVSAEIYHVNNED